MSNLGGKKYCQDCNQEGSNGIKFIKAANSIFNETLKPIIRGDIDGRTPLHLGCPSQLLLDNGFHNLPIEITVQRLTDKNVQENHPFSLTSVFDMPEHISNPIAIFQSETSSNPNMKVVLTDMEHDGVNFALAIELNKDIRRSGNVNSVRSLYPKDNLRPVLRWIIEGVLVIYVNKQKFLNFLSKQQFVPADVTQLIKEAAKIVNSM
jgi:hypothetical protein